MPEIDLVIFDMAGTTVQDDGQVPAAFEAALAEHGIAVSAETIRGVRGASKRQAIAALMPDGPERVEQVYASFRGHLARLYRAGVRSVPETETVFAWLRGRGIRVALNTGFDRDTVQLLLTALGWADGVVDAVVCGDEVARGRPAPYLIFRCMEAAGVESVHRVAAIGDTVLDLRAGHNAGVHLNLGVLSGAGSREQLAAEPHTSLLASVAEFPGLLKSD
jgi:phosphonatase-like hydrolase